MIGSRLSGAALVLILSACLVGLPSAGLAVSAAQGIASSAPASGPSELDRRADTFPLCVEQRRCRTDDNGRRRCREVERCQECRYVKQCDGQGCAWRQVCEWGPYKPVLRTN